MSELAEIVKRLRKGTPCRVTLGHGESCSIGYLCGGCEARVKAAEALVAVERVHDERVAELLAANNREVERRRAGEAVCRQLIEWGERCDRDDGDDFLNGDSEDGRNGVEEMDALLKRVREFLRT